MKIYQLKNKKNKLSIAKLHFIKIYKPFKIEDFFVKKKEIGTNSAC